MKNLLFVILTLLFPLAAVAQEPQGKPFVPQSLEDVNRVSDLTLDSINIAKSARPIPGSSRKGTNPVLFLVGNSTMRTGTLGNGNNGQWGWGYFAHLYFDESRISVENHALGGTSSRTFYRRLWPEVLEGIREGDWVIIELGHNDNGPYDEGRARASIPGVGKDSLEVTIKETGEKETVYSYGEYMRRFILDVRSRGAYPVLCSLTPRNSWEADGTITRKATTFTLWQKQICAEMDVPFIDLEGTTARKFELFGPEKVNYHFYLDKIHSSEFGARNNARSAAEAILACEGLALKDYLTPADTWYPTQVKSQEGAYRPRVFFCGDSTMQNEDRDADSMWGWGSVVSSIFKKEKVEVINAGKAGRSARTYLEEERWERVYNSLRPGDFVVIQFGHNDMGDIATGKARADISGTADSSHVYRLEKDRSYKVVYTYGWYLRKMVQDAREKGAIPILVSMTPRNEWMQEKVPAGKKPSAVSHIERRPGTCATWAQEVAEQLDVPFVDMHNLTADWLDKHAGSKEKASPYFKNDHTHTSLLGARLNAAMFAKGLKETDCPLKKYLNVHSSRVPKKKAPTPTRE